MWGPLHGVVWFCASRWRRKQVDSCTICKPITASGAGGAELRTGALTESGVWLRHPPNKDSQQTKRCPEQQRKCYIFALNQQHWRFYSDFKGLHRDRSSTSLCGQLTFKKVTMLDWKENKKSGNLLLHGKDHKLWECLPLPHVTDLPLPVDGGLSSELFGQTHMTSQKCAIAKIYFFSSQKANKIFQKRDLSLALVLMIGLGND